MVGMLSSSRGATVPMGRGQRSESPRPIQISSKKFERYEKAAAALQAYVRGILLHNNAR